MSTQRRHKPLRPDIHPLTPTIPELPETTAPKSTGQKLAQLHRTLEVERKRNAKTVNVLTRYIGLLEHVVTSQREAFEQLENPLIPGQSTRKN